MLLRGWSVGQSNKIIYVLGHHSALRLQWTREKLDKWDEFLLWNMSLVQDRSLNMLISSPVCYHCTTAAPVPQSVGGQWRPAGQSKWSVCWAHIKTERLLMASLWIGLSSYTPGQGGRKRQGERGGRGEREHRKINPSQCNLLTGQLRIASCGHCRTMGSDRRNGQQWWYRGQYDNEWRWTSCQFSQFDK